MMLRGNNYLKGEIILFEAKCETDHVSLKPLSFSPSFLCSFLISPCKVPYNFPWLGGKPCKVSKKLKRERIVFGSHLFGSSIAIKFSTGRRQLEACTWFLFDLALCAYFLC